MKKQLFLLSCFTVLLALSLGCTKVADYNFIDYGLNATTNEIVKSSDGKLLTWVFQEASGDQSLNKVFSAKANGANKVELLSVELEKEKSVRVLGVYPEQAVFVYAIEYKNPDFGPIIQRNTFYKFFNEAGSHSIGNNYLAFFQGDRGVAGLRVGDVLAVYQLSMSNAYALDSKSNYNTDKKIISAFTDARTTSDLKRVVYTFEYDPATQGYNQNKLLASDIEGTNRKEILATDKPIEIIEVIGNDRVKVKVDDEEKEFTF